MAATRCLALLLAFLAYAHCLNVFSQRVDVPSPDGSGVAFVQLQADPWDPNYNLLAGFNITGFTFINNEQSLRLWDPVAEDCSGTLLSSGSNYVPADGKLCFFSNITTGSAEFQDSFTFVAFGDPSAGNTGTVTLLNYNKQLCPAIPDLGASGSVVAPPAPTATITLQGLEIHFSVTATYLRNQTSWYLDFWDFDSTPGQDMADGSGRTCCNQIPSNHSGVFSSWWYSAPRATYTSALDASIDNALNDPTVYPNYSPTGSVWSVTATDCAHINFQATIPVSHLILNATSGCHKTGSIAAACTTTGGLVYTGALYVNSLRPVDLNNALSGYYRSSFIFPFTFSIQSTVSDIVGSSSKWAFAVSVLYSLVTYTGSTPNYTLQLQTSISSATATSPNIASFNLITFPYDSLHTGGAAPVLTRVGDNGNCGTSSTNPCVITWQMVMPELATGLFGDIATFNTQYIGKYSFQWTTTGSDVLAADVYVDVSAANPAQNLSQIPVNSSLSFYADQSTMQDINNPGMAVPVYNSGERIWVRHSFLVDPADITAFYFNLTTAYVCTSNVPGFFPSLANGRTGCAVDIPGVMEASQGQRYLLFDTTLLPLGIPDINGTATGGHDTYWGWEQIISTDSGWSFGSTVNNGFSINALPLAIDGTQRTWYFHLVSEVSQVPLTRRREVVHQIIRASPSSSSGNLEGVSIASSGSSSDATRLAPVWELLLSQTENLWQ